VDTPAPVGKTPFLRTPPARTSVGTPSAFATVRAQNLRGGRNVALYWDGGIRLEVGVELAVAFETDGEVVPSHTPAGQAATVTHFGPYAQLGGAHEAIREWCQTHGYRLVGPSWEVYDHWQDSWNSNPSGIRTDVFYQVATVASSASEHDL